MGALESLRSILPLEDGTIDIDDASQLDNLQSYISYQKQQENPLPQLLESIRIDAFNEKASDLSEINLLGISDVSRLTERFVNYQDNIRKHREKLLPIENIILDFNTELGQLSSSLVSLQEQSVRLSSDVSLERATTEKLNPFILDLMIPPEVVRSIMKDPIDAKWLENIRFINEKQQLIASVKTETHDSNISEAYKQSQAFVQLESDIQLLIGKSVERVRDFIISQIKLLRSPSNPSSQAIQQKLLQVKDIFVFLQTHHRVLANQLQLAYIYTMKWYYQTRFAKYIYAIEKLHLRHIDSNLVLGSGTNDDRSSLYGLKSWLYNGSNSLHSQPSHNPSQVQQNPITMSEYLLSIDKRIQVLERKASTEPQLAIPSQIAETTPFMYWLEFIYNQWSIALIDNIVVEYLFMVEFFYQGDERFENIDSMDNSTTSENSNKDWSHVMFENVYKMGNEFVCWLISYTPSQYGRNNTTTSSTRMGPLSSFHGTCDAYAILLMIRLIQNSQSLLHNEFRIPILDDYLNSILLILWPHFTKIIDLNCESMKKVIMHSSNEANLAPVGLTQQFAQFLSGLLKLASSTSKEKNKDFRGEPLFTSINRLRNDFESVLTKLSNRLFGSGKNKSTEKEILLYNNYFLVVSILKNENGSSANDFIEEQIKHFEILCDAYKK